MSTARFALTPLLGGVEVLEGILDGDAEPEGPARAKTVPQSPSSREDNHDRQGGHRENETADEENAWHDPL
jgi:hypothetical protein